MQMPHKFLIPQFGKNKVWVTLINQQSTFRLNVIGIPKLTDLMYKAFLCNVGDCLVISS